MRIGASLLLGRPRGGRKAVARRTVRRALPAPPCRNAASLLVCEGFASWSGDGGPRCVSRRCRFTLRCGEVIVQRESEELRSLPARAPGSLRPGERTRCLRPRLHRPHQGTEEPRDRHAGVVDPQEPHASRRHRRRSAAGRRRGHPDPAPRPVPAQGVRCAGPDAAGHRPVRRRHGVPAEGAGVADGVRAGDRARRGERGPDSARLARRADEQQRPLARTKEVEPVIRQVFIARGSNDDGPGRARAQALHHPQEVGPRDPGAEAAPRQGVLRAVDVDAHARLQGHAARAPGRRVLTSISRTTRWSRRSRWCTSASRPTRSPRGISRIRSGSSATTARSTRCAATSTGSARGSTGSRARCWAPTSTRSGR